MCSFVSFLSMFLILIRVLHISVVMLFIAEECSIVFCCIPLCHTWFTHSDGQLGYLQFLLTMNKAVIIFTSTCRHIFSLLVGKYINEELLGSG